MDVMRVVSGRFDIEPEAAKSPTAAKSGSLQGKDSVGNRLLLFLNDLEVLHSPVSRKRSTKCKESTFGSQGGLRL